MNVPNTNFQTDNIAQRQKEELVRRFVNLPLEKRCHFLTQLREQGIDFSLLPVPAGLAGTDDVPLSYAQQRLWFFSRLDSSSTAYHMTGGLHIRGALNVEAVRAVFARIQARHAALRTTFHEIDGQAVQRIHALQALPYDEFDYSGEQQLNDAEIRALAQAEARRPFDLTHGPLWRITLIHLPGSEFELWLSLHHIVADGWSLNCLMHEFSRFYQMDQRDSLRDIEAPKITYADYAIWQRAWLEAGEADRQLAFWQSYLAGEQPLLRLPEDFARPVTPSYRGGRVPFSCDEKLTERLKELARLHGTTVSNVLLSAFFIVLYRYSGQCGLRVGIPLANRDRSEVQDVVGFFVNTVVVHISIQGQLYVHELLHAVRTAMVNAQAHPDLPFEQLVDTLPHARSLDRNPLFQAMYNHQKRAYDALDNLSGLEISPIDRDAGGAQVDLSLDTEEFGGDAGLNGFFTYAEDLFEAATIEQLSDHYLQILYGLAEPGKRRIEQLVLNPPHRTAKTRTALAADPSASAGCDFEPVHLLFSRRARLQPERQALVYHDQSISYRELDDDSSKLARHLPLTAEMLVGIVLARSPKMIVTMLAVLKAGGAFLSLDPNDPPERRAAILQDAKIGLLVTELDQYGVFPELPGAKVVDIDQVWQEKEQPDAASNTFHSHQLAYVIYTSGSTGQPKGVAVAHGALNMHCQAMIGHYDLTADDRFLHFAPFQVDTSIEQWMVPLLCGATVVLKSAELWDGDRLLDEIAANAVSRIDLPPGYAAVIAECAEKQKRGLHLRSCTVGGEALGREVLASILKVLRPDAVFNAYGPTEAVITPMLWKTSQMIERLSHYAPIGEVVGERSAYILDSDLNEVPAGVSGELYLGGFGLARGYHGHGRLTAERFIPDPYSRSGDRLYRTGDLCRMRADGQLEFLGRIDDQLKLRGYRIEPGEIESVLLELDGVREAVVELRTVAASKILVAYLGGDPAQPGEEWIQQILSERLPHYMVPAHIVILAALPRTVSGKIDRRALPEPAMAASGAVAPETETEKHLAQIWCDVLGLAEIGRLDNFFALGGDSIIALQVVSRAKQKGIHVSPKDIFQYQTLAKLALVVRESTQGDQAEQVAAQGVLQLLPIQRWFFEERIPHHHHWNQSVLLRISAGIQAELLQTGLEHLLRQHDALRLGFAETEDQGWQAFFMDFAHVNKEMLWRRSVSSGDELEAVCNEAQHSLSLQHGPLLRAVLTSLPGGEQRLLLVIHHLVVDGVSWRVLLEDLQTAYSQLLDGKPVTLPPKTSSIQTWSARLQSYTRSDVLQQQLAYWQTELADSKNDLPCDNPGGSLQSKHAQRAMSRLNKEWTANLLKKAPAAYRTRINELLITALARVIVRWTCQSSVMIQLEGHGRETLFEDVDVTRTVGWFTTLYPVRLNPVDSLDFSIKNIKEQLRSVPDQGVGFGILRYLGTDTIRRQMQALPAPKITFNYLGQFDGSFDQQNGIFKPAKEGKGLGRSPEAPLDNWLSIDGQIYDGELELCWTFSGEMYAKSTIQALADAYTFELQTLIAHCCRQENYAVTSSDFPLARLSQAQLDALAVPAAQIEDIYPLSPMQQGMLFHSLNAPEEGSYLNQLRVDVHGLDVARFRQTWQNVLSRHAILRAGFFWEGFDEPIQVIHRQVTLSLQVRDWREQIEAEFHGSLDGALAQLAKKRIDSGFVLTAPPLMHLDLVCVADNCHHMIYTSHHILMDGWSNSQLLGEVLQSYQGQFSVTSPGSYRDYLVWLQERDAAASECFWREQLAELQEPTLLADTVCNTQNGQPHELVDGEIWGGYSSTLTEAETGHIGDFARQQRVTVNTVLQAVWLLLLQRYTGKNCVTFGATVAGRPAEVPGIEQQLGLFINTLPVVGRMNPVECAGDWARRVQAQNLSLREHQHTPLYEIQRWVGQGGAALFDNIIVFENFPVAEALQKGAPPGLQFGKAENYEQTNYALTLAVNLSTCLNVQCHYDRRKFSDAVIQQLMRQFLDLLNAFTCNTDQAIGNLSLLGKVEKRRILNEWNSTETGAGADACIHSLFEAQVAKTPQATALLLPQQMYEQRMTYAELNTRANRLAHRLRSLHVGPDVLVGVAVERSVEMVVGLLALLKAGGAYVPLDPEYPAERLNYMITDSGIDLLLTQAHLHAHLSVPDNVRVLNLDDEPETGWDQESGENLPLISRPENLAFVIYTSGSTGKPKGVAVTHGSLAQHISTFIALIQLSDKDCVLQFSTFSFDTFAEQLYPALACGAQVILRGTEIWDKEVFCRNLIRCNVSVADLPAAYWYQLVKDFATERPQSYGRLRQVLVGGEAMPKQGLSAWQQAGMSHIALLNAYGSTEATVTSTAFACGQRLQEANVSALPVPIGKSLKGRTSYIFDNDLNPLPIGVTGELYLGGSCLARGYHGRSGWTAERFVPDPYSEAGGRLYRTGDLARVLPDGNIEYVGRVDHQVKIRGFRVELGEIESRLHEQTTVAEAVVVSQPGPGGHQLVAYVVPAIDGVFEAQAETRHTFQEDLRIRLQAVLPDYMVPQHYVFMQSMPLTLSGKIDRKALPAPERISSDVSLPETAWELKLAGLWREILNVELVGRADNFFDLGGHSLLAMRLVAKIKSAWHLDVSVRDIFENPLLTGQAGILQTLSESSTSNHDQDSDLADAFAELQAMSQEELEELTGSKKTSPRSQ